MRRADLLPATGVQLLPAQRLPRGQHRLPAVSNADRKAIARQLEPLPEARCQGVSASRFEACIGQEKGFNLFAGRSAKLRDPPLVQTHLLARCRRAQHPDYLR